MVLARDTPREATRLPSPFREVSTTANSSSVIFPVDCSGPSRGLGLEDLSKSAK